MKDNYIFYEANGKQYKISESDSAEFENDFPEAKVNLSANGKKYLIGIKEKEDFFNDFGADNVQYTSFEEKPQEINKETTEVSERPSWGKTIVKSAGSALSTLGKMFADAATLHAAGQVIDNPRTGEIYTMPDFDSLIKDESVPSVAASNRLRETAERLSKEADPTGGEKGFTDLISEGNVGMALQKGLATAIESAPMTLSAYNPYTMGLYMALNSASNFANETRENPEVDKVKRATMAIGSAAFEQAVEKFADPIFKYIGGGKAIGELTEDVAKEILEKGTKEATAGIAERIIRVLKNTGKDALGEGAEEVVTSFGNDALGQALDWIDGDQDYGIIAQWNQFKESNPNASESDFAKSKAKEYMDSFIGGALSGTYMSGTAQTAQEGFQYMADANIANKINNAKKYGSTLSYQDIYDSDDIVREANKRVSDAFTNKNGVSAFSEEFVGGLTSEKAFELSRTEGLPTEQRVALEGLAQAKAAQEGLNEKLDENLETAIRTDIERVKSSAEDGVITKGVYGDRHVYVKGGVAKNGSITLPNGENGPVVIIDTATGEQSTVRSEDIYNAMSEDATNFALNLELSWRDSDEATREQARNTMSAKAKLRAIQPLEGKKVMIDLGSGLTEVNIQQILPQSGEVLIKGKKGDLGGQSNVKIGADVFYEAISRDDNGNPIVTDGDIEVEDETPDVAQTEVAVEDDFRGEVATILINGVPVDVEVISQDNPSDTIVYEYTDENGNTKRGRTTIGGFKDAIQQTAETPAIPEEPVAETPVAEDPVPVEEAPAAEEAPVEETTLTPESIDWDALFEQDPEAYFVELQNQFGEETLDILNEEVDAAQSELDSLAKAKTKSQNERLENRRKKASLQKRIEILNGMIARLTPAQDVVVEVPVENTPVEEAPEAPANVIPEVPAEEPVAEAPAEEPAVVQAEPQPTTPVAPNPVDNPIREAQKKEKSLATQLKRYDLTHELKQDLAFKAGKAVADFFATREEYEAYAENATDFGDYNEDFERGVDESFANRPQNTGNSPVNSVPLGTEPKGGNNGEQGEEDGTSGNGPSVPDNSGRTTDGGTEGGDQTSPKVGKGKANKGKAGNKVADKYPARKGNATQKLLVDTFGFNKVEIPNSRKETLNTIYDFMMAMSKMLGISPKSIGQGGWLDVGSLRSNAQSSAEHSLLSKVIDQSVVKATLKYKYAKIKGLAHEWWHALDHALSYFETGKGKFTASEIPASRFTGRQETWYAVNQVIKAIKDSGHESRMFTLKFPRRYVDYFVEPSEMAARAFEEYMKAKFAAAGIIIENAEDTDFVAQPTAEEMAVITPAFDNLFNVLQEKEGKTPGTSVLFHIGEMMEPESEAKVLATDAVALALGENSGINLYAATDEDVAQMMDAAGADTKAELMVASDRPVFVSNAAIAVEAIKQEKATPEQWLKMIEKNGGLKAGEDKWMGLSDWLMASDKKTLTKQEVLDFIKENTIQIEEVNYGEIDFIKEDKKQTDAIQKEFDEIANSFMDQGYTIKHSYFLAFDKMKDKYGDDFSLAFDMYDGVLFVNNRDAASSITGIEYSGKGINETRLGYTTNGLTNLKEIAIVVPTIEAWNEGDEIHFGDAGDGRAVAWVRFGETSAIVEDANYVRLQEIYDRLNELESKVASEGITMEEYEERERLREERDSIPESRTQRILVIDEIQSKRHQEGREQGYKVSREKADAEMEKFMDKMHSKYEFTSSTPFAEVFNEDEMREYARLYMQQHRATFGTTSIPDAPFDKNWHELAMKRMLRYAAENGYDAIAWTKGAQQAERYDIGQSVKTIEKGREYDNGIRYTLYDNSDTGRSIFVKDGIVTDAYFDELQGKPLSEAVGKEMADAMLSMEEGEIKDTKGMIGGEGMKGFYDKILPAFMNKYGKKWGAKVSDISLPFVESAGRVMHSVPVTQSMKDSVLEGQPMFMKRPNGIVYGWAIDNNIYYTKAGFNTNTLTHEYTHIWARAMMQKNPKGWNSIKSLLRGTPVWDEVMNDANYSNIHSNEDMVTSEVLSRISGTENAAKLEQMAQQMIDEAKGTARKLEARGLIQRIKDALNEFWSWVGKNLFEIENFNSVEEITDRVLWDLMNKTDLGELSEGQVETQIVTDPKVIAELEASPKRTGYRNVVQNEDGSFSSPMAYWLQNPDVGAKSRIATAKFEMGKWEEAEEHPEVVSEKGYVTLVKPNKKTVGSVAYDPYIHNRLDPVNLQFKEAWKRDDLVYIETEVAETDLESGYHADKAKLPVGVHSWSNGAVMLSKYDKPVRVLPWEDVANAWAARLNGEGVEFDVVPPALLPLLVERGVEILPPHKNSGKDCENAYAEFKNAQETKTTSGERGGAVSGNPSSEGLPLDDRGHLSHNSLVHPIDLANVEKNTIATKAAIKKLFNRGSFKEKITDALSAVREVSKALKLVKSDSSLSYYSDLYEGDFEINGKIAHVRISGHPANGERMGNAQVDTKISLVIYDNGEHVSTGIHEGYVEYTYYPSDIDPEDAAWSIANGIKSLLEGNGFVDNSGKAKEQPYPYNNGKGNFVYRKADAQNAAVDFLAGEPRLRVIENAVNEEAAKLGVSVTYKTREEMPKGHENDKGYYNTNTGEIVICTENASSISDAIQTILHESVAHKGLRQLMGDKFNEFINRVYESLDAETKAKVDALADEHYDGNTAVATEEYMASLAETEDFANNSLWEKIKSIFEDIINAILGRNDIKIGDNELRYILRASYNNMVNPRGMESMRVWAQDQMMREEYNINQASPEILSRTGIDPTEVSRESAKAVYDKMVADRWQEFQRQFQDAMQPVRIAIDAIQQETGNLPIEDYENFILIQNQASSRSRVEMDIFARNYYSPIVEQVNNVIDVILEARGYDKKNRKKRSEVYAEIRQYLIAKHGLERNEYYQSTKTRKLTAWEKTKETDAVQKEYDEKVNIINTDTTLTDAERELQLRDALDELNAAIEEINTREVPDLRDYSGLTALFGMDPKKFREAEAEAQQLVDKFEAEAGSVTEEMWKKINAATDKTLRHSYESGMISRQQYNDIKSMFKFYIPLRGFDETTAEDVYSYARFEGNRFNPAVQSAGGRTSLADDPLAIIMNMAESEIAQGNKNRAKQALYNFILNRPLTDSQGNQVQNSLMQIESVWYMKNTDSDGNDIYTIAVPDHENGETYEEFENRMQALAAEDKAYKSKKGKVDVGMRFQKQQNRDAHYVYLKVNGVDKAIYINGDPKAADAINGIYGKPKGELAEKMGTLNRFISSTFTNYSLEFTARNYFRDMFYSHINIDVKEKDPAYRKKFRQNWRHNNLGTMMRMLKAYRAGEFEGRPLNEDEAAFVEFMANGGQTGYTVINSVENHKAELERAIKNMQNGIEKGGIKDSTVFKYTLGSIELLNEASELVTRFAAFKTSRDMGRGVETSINDAKEITVNFNTKGAQDGKGLFGAIARYFGWYKFFFNASVQGVQNIKAMAEANKLKFCSTVGGVAAIGFLMPVFTAVIAEILGGDEDEYWNIPEYDRQNNFCIPLGNGKYAKIPLPIGFREVYAIGDMVAAMAWDKKFTRDFGQVGTDIANKIASVVLPINPLESAANGLSLWHTLLYTALPSSAQFAIQNATNIDWKGAPLQKEYTYNEDDPQWMKAFNSNPSWMVGLSKWCNEHIGSGDMKGWDWSPEKLDNTLSSVFGGVYNLVKKTGRSISMIWNEENRNLSNIPLSGVILGSGIESDDRFMTDAYYDMNEYYDQRIGFIKRRAKTFGYSLEDVFEKKKGRHHPKMQEIYGNSEFEWIREWYFGNKDLDKVNDKIKKLKKEIEAKENPTQDKLNRLSRLMNEFEDERRDFVNDMLELD